MQWLELPCVSVVRLLLVACQVSTSMVNELVVKALTLEDQCRLVDLPDVVPKVRPCPPAGGRGAPVL
jgi:hypothetical protein